MMHDFARKFARDWHRGRHGGARIWGLGYSKEWGGWKAGGWDSARAAGT